MKVPKAQGSSMGVAQLALALPSRLNCLSIGNVPARQLHPFFKMSVYESSHSYYSQLLQSLCARSCHCQYSLNTTRTDHIEPSKVERQGEKIHFRNGVNIPEPLKFVSNIAQRT
jgi:hypothetical protein